MSAEPFFNRRIISLSPNRHFSLGSCSRPYVKQTALFIFICSQLYLIYIQILDLVMLNQVYKEKFGTPRQGLLVFKMQQ